MSRYDEPEPEWFPNDGDRQWWREKHVRPTAEMVEVTPAMTAMVDESDERWITFWARYFRRDAKRDARKAFAQLDPDWPLVQIILTALEWQGPIMRQQPTRFRPLPATWLRGRRWEDERPVPVRPVSDAPLWQGWECPHVEPCNNRSTCEIRTAQGRPEKGGSAT